MTEASRYLFALAERIAAVYVAQTGPHAVLLTGSVAEGVSDYYSDVDLIAYYDQLPTDAQFAEARSELGVADVRVNSDQSAGRWHRGEHFLLGGVECQVAHFTIAPWETHWAKVVEEFTPGTETQKVIMGVLEGVALHGDDLIAGWKAYLSAYSEQLAEASVKHYLRFFPLWEWTERFESRDAKLFYYQMLVEASQNLLGVLAGLNRRYYSTFQFKRMRRFVGRLRVAPEHLADRLDALFALDPAEAGIELERLVVETVVLVETHMPSVDTASVRRLIGMRQRPWTPESLGSRV